MSLFLRNLRDLLFNNTKAPHYRLNRRSFASLTGVRRCWYSSQVLNEKGERLASSRWFPPEPTGRILQWLLLVLATGHILTNAYYLQFAEPAISRKSLAVGILALALLWMAVRRFGVPRTGSEWMVVLGSRWVFLALGVILLIAYYLRVWGISSGLPQSYVSDEYDYVHRYLQMIKRGDLNPRWWHHPSLKTYVNMVAYLVVFFLEVPTGRWFSVHQLSVEDMLYWGRFAAGVLPGTAVVLVTFFLGRRLFGTRVGLVGALLLAVFPGAVEASQYNKPDALLVLTTALSVLVTLVYLAKGGKKLAFVCGMVLGLTVAAKYNGALVVLPFCLAVVLRHGRRFLTEPDLFLGAAGSILGFSVACPFFIVEIPRSLDQVADGLWRYGHFGREGAEGVDNWAGHFYYTVHYGAGWLATLAGLGGLALALYRLDGRLAVFLTFPVLYYSYYSSQRMLFPGNLIPVYPFLAILAAYALGEASALAGRVLQSFSRFTHTAAVERFGFGVLLVVTLWFPVNMTLLWNRLATLPDTGSVAAQWIEAHYPPGTHFAVERHTPVLDPERYKITMEARIINRSVKDYRSDGVQYLIVTDIIYKRYGPEHRQTKNYQKLFKICALVKEFQPVDGKLEGPVIRILRVPK